MNPTPANGQIFTLPAKLVINLIAVSYHRSREVFQEFSGMICAAGGLPVIENNRPSTLRRAQFVRDEFSGDAGTNGTAESGMVTGSGMDKGTISGSTWLASSSLGRCFQ